eukprot:2956604-Amphidinium_carterae.1
MSPEEISQLGQAITAIEQAGYGARMKFFARLAPSEEGEAATANRNLAISSLFQKTDLCRRAQQTARVVQEACVPDRLSGAIAQAKMAAELGAGYAFRCRATTFLSM